jgi:CobQ-like glutamine amidotransferase family enzyme
MKIEILFPEFCNLYGDMFNMKYLKKCLPEAEFIETALEEEPTFVKENVNLIYLGPMTEKTQEKVISKLLPYKERIIDLIEKNTVFLFTGNAVEVLGKYIENEDETRIEGLGIFDVYAKRDMFHRHNSFLIGKYEDIEVIGFKSQFTMLYGDNTNMAFLEVEKGIGINKESKLEGIKKNNFIGTYLIGPLLILNPLFTKKILEMLGVESRVALEEETMAAYEERIKEFRRL